MVFAETMPTDKLVDMVPCPSGAETTQSSELSQTESETDKIPTTAESVNTPGDVRTLYAAALFLKRLINDCPGMSCPWPPTSEDLDINECCSARTI